MIDQRRLASRRGSSLIEVMVALSLVAGLALIASTAGLAVVRLEAAAHAEAVGLTAAEDVVQRLAGLPRAERVAGSDELDAPPVEVHREWRVFADDPAPGLTRVESSAAWREPSSDPSARVRLTLVAVLP